MVYTPPQCLSPYKEKAAGGFRLWGHVPRNLPELTALSPDLTSQLVGVLIRFRKEAVVLMADVEAMFLQVKVPPEDCDLLRVLWWPDGDCEKKLIEYRMVAHLFGATSFPSCACFALRKCAEDN